MTLLHLEKENNPYTELEVTLSEEGNLVINTYSDGPTYYKFELTPEEEQALFLLLADRALDALQNS